MAQLRGISDPAAFERAGIFDKLAFPADPAWPVLSDEQRSVQRSIISLRLHNRPAPHLNRADLRFPDVVASIRR